jgi:hypothetical protein
LELPESAAFADSDVAAPFRTAFPFLKLLNPMTETTTATATITQM